jgi:hypothetical protein
VRARYGPDRLQAPERTVSKPTDVIGK